MATIDPTFASRLRERRSGLGMSQRELARGADLPQSVIGRYETGQQTPSYDSLIRLADALDVSLDWLTGRD